MCIRDRDVGLSPGDFVLDEDPVPSPKKGADHPNFGPMFIVAKQLDGSLGTKVGLNPGDSVLHGDPAPLPTWGWSPLPTFRPIFGRPFVKRFALSPYAIGPLSVCLYACL